MKTFRIKLSALAVVRQYQMFQAESAEEANKIALNSYNDHDWKYEGLYEACSPNVEIDSVETLSPDGMTWIT